MGVPGAEGATDAGHQAWSNTVAGKCSKPGPVLNNKDNSKRGCWATFSGCVGGMWATRQMTNKEDREIYVRTTLRELVVYIIFLTVMCILTFGVTSSTMYYYTKVLSDLFLEAPYPDTRNTLSASTQVMDFWRFTQNILLDGLYWEYWYDPQMTPTQRQDRNILYENRMLGVPRMKMVRVTSNSCDVAPDFQKTIRDCYDSYYSTKEDTEPFGPKIGTAWNYYTADELGGTSYWGKLATYSGAGSFVDFRTQRNETEVLLANLRENLWITRGTRAVFIDFTVYNANINLFCVIKLCIEFPATGGIIPSWSFRTVKLLRYVTPFDYFVLACECIFILFIVYYIVEETIEIMNLKCVYFKSLWNVLDLVVIVLSLTCIGFNIFCVLTISEKLEELLKYPDKFANFEFLGYWQSQFNSAVAVCVFFSWFKIFKYISFNKTMTQFSSTISRCAKDVAGFAVMFFIVFFAFSQLGYLLFGTQVEDFSTFISSVFTLLRTILGDFNFQAIESANRILGPIFFICYVFFVFFVLLNMFLAIINDTYSEVKLEIANQKNEFEIGDYFKRGYNNMLGKFGKRDKIIDIENALKLSDDNSDGRLSFDEVRNNLKKCNFSDMEIEMFFARYDIDHTRFIEHDELKAMLADLSGTNQHDNQVHTITQHDRPQTVREIRTALTARAQGRPHTAIGTTVPSVSLEEFRTMERRMNQMEHSIGSISFKIDAILMKVQHMEENKTKRKKNLGTMFDDIIDDKDLDNGNKKDEAGNIAEGCLDALPSPKLT